MPLVASNDPGNFDGSVHSHRFPAANTAVPFVNHDEKQLQVTKDFLTDGIVSVDIFAVSPIRTEGGAPEMRRRQTDTPVLSTGFAVGEEAESGAGPVLIREVGEIAAPIDRARPVLSPGDTAKVDVVVRTRKVGHFFPGGTVDSFDVWLELQAFDADGRVIFWSGRVEDGGEGPVEPGAHFYRAFLLDEHGNPINKRNAFQARALLYARLIPPGAADVGHFKLKIPEDARGPIRLAAKLNYRKFSHYYTQFSYAGQPDPASAGHFAKGFDDRDFTFLPANIPANVSGNIKDRIPNLPIVVLASAEAEIPLGDGPTQWKPVVTAEDHLRWNDYGIGLLLQGDLKGAQHAFERVIEAKPDFADGWLNVGRALIQEGQTEAARPFVAKALEINDSLGRSHFFLAMIQKAEGDYDGALASLRRVEKQYPRDRVVLNQMARILFLKREYRQAIEVLGRVARVDPEDLQMHYTSMLCYRGLGDLENAAREETLFRRFKADESAQTITARIRRLSPEDNNERQPIHEHVSVDLASKPAGELLQSVKGGATGGLQ
jgi:tetratricopeptide (TPR) repeat protein